MGHTLVLFELYFGIIRILIIGTRNGAIII